MALGAGLASAPRGKSRTPTDRSDPDRSRHRSPPPPRPSPPQVGRTPTPNGTSNAWRRSRKTDGVRAHARCHDVVTARGSSPPSRFGIPHPAEGGPEARPRDGSGPQSMQQQAADLSVEQVRANRLADNASAERAEWDHDQGGSCCRSSSRRSPPAASTPSACANWNTVASGCASQAPSSTALRRAPVPPTIGDQ